MLLSTQQERTQPEIYNKVTGWFTDCGLTPNQEDHKLFCDEIAKIDEMGLDKWNAQTDLPTVHCRIIIQLHGEWSDEKNANVHPELKKALFRHLQSKGINPSETPDINVMLHYILTMMVYGYKNLPQSFHGQKYSDGVREALLDTSEYYLTYLRRRIDKNNLDTVKFTGRQVLQIIKWIAKNHNNTNNAAYDAVKMLTGNESFDHDNAISDFRHYQSDLDYLIYSL